MTSHTLLLNTMYAKRTEAGPLNRHQRAHNGRTVKCTGWYNYFFGAEFFMSFGVTTMASQSCSASMPGNFRNIYGNIVNKRKGIAFIAMRFFVAQQQFIFLYIFFK